MHGLSVIADSIPSDECEDKNGFDASMNGNECLRNRTNATGVYFNRIE